MKNPMSIRLDDLTKQQLDEMAARFATTQARIVSTAIDRMYQQETQTMNTQTQQMLDELKAAPSLNRFEREQLEDKYADKLPLHSGTIAYTDNLIVSIIKQVEDFVSDWEHAATLVDMPYAPNLETCQNNIRRGKEIIQYLTA